MKKRYIIHKCISPMEVRMLCMKQNWYTRGTGIDYEQMLDSLLDKDHMSRDNITDQDILDLSENIVQHSDLGDLEEGTDPVAHVAFEVAQLVRTIFEAV